MAEKNLQELILTLSKCNFDSVPPPFSLGRGKPAGDVELTDNAEVSEILLLAGKICDLESFVPRISVVWNSRFLSVCGRASPGINKIELSSKLWNFFDNVHKREVLIHEVCHLFDFEKYPRSVKVNAHGDTWKEFMRKCGFDSARSIIPLPCKVPGILYYVFCRCGEHRLTPQAFGRIKSGKILYCPKCGADVKPVPYEENI